jgi:EXPERA (EXPanded EBP superfamily)
MFALSANLSVLIVTWVRIKVICDKCPVSIIFLRSMLDAQSRSRQSFAMATTKTNGSGSAANGSSRPVVKHRPGLGGCQWVDWDAYQSLPDLTRLFSLTVIGIMTFRYLQAHQWNFMLVMTGFYLHPLVILFFVLATATVYLGLSGSEQFEPLPRYERWIVEWYWWNAWLFHMTMDGASGTYRLIPVVVQQYDILDQRFPTGNVMPWVIGWIELFMHGPLCLVTLYAILQRHPLRFPLEIVTSTFQFFGMVGFILGELYEGQIHVPAKDPVGTLVTAVDGTVSINSWGNVKFLDMYHFVYYWFGFWFCNLIWAVVPYVSVCVHFVLLRL